MLDVDPNREIIHHEHRVQPPLHTRDEEALMDVEVARIELDPSNERHEFAGDLDELLSSVRTLGLQERVRLYQLPTGRYLVASGHRRITAVRALGWVTVPAIVTAPPSDAIKQVTSRLASNLCRKDIDPIAFAHSIQTLLEVWAVPLHQVAAWLGRSPATITNQVRLLGLSKEVQAQVTKGNLTTGHALLLLRIRDDEQDWDGSIVATADECRLRLANAVVLEKLTVRALEIRVKNVLDNNRAVNAWLSKQRSMGASMHCVTGNIVMATNMDSVPAYDSEQMLQRRKAVAHEAIANAIDFNEQDGPTIDHVRMAAMLLADMIYFYHNTRATGLPEHGEIIRRIEKAADEKSVLNLIGSLVNAVILSGLTLQGTNLVGRGRAKWAKGHFGLTAAVSMALQALAPDGPSS